MDKSKISICIPVYNGEAYIEAAVESAINQTEHAFEIVICDNSSTDETCCIVEKLASQYPKIKLYKNNENLGLAGNLNRCLEVAQGDYIKYLCADDLLLPNSIEVMSKILDTQPNVGLVCGARVSINEQGKTFGTRCYSSNVGTEIGTSVISRCLYLGCLIGEPTAVMFRKRDVQTQFREDLPQLMDMAFWFQLLEKSVLFNINQPVCVIRFHSQQMTNVNIKTGALVNDNLKVFSEYQDKPYIQKRLSFILKHKLLMTYRIWLCQHSMEPSQVNSALAKHGYKLLFLLMPFLAPLNGLRKSFNSRKLSP